MQTKIALSALLLIFSSSSVVAQPFAYITNHSDDTVSVIDTATNVVVDTVVDVVGRPASAAVHPDGNRVYTANPSNNSVSVIDANTNTVVDTITVEAAPVGVAVHPDGSTLYVTNHNADSVSVIDTTTNVVSVSVAVGSRPQGVALLPDGTKAYVTNRFGNTVSVIDTATNTVVDTITGVGSDNRDIEVHPNGSMLYLVNFASDTVSVIDTATNALVDTVPVEDAPNGLGVHPDGATVYVANFGSNTVSVIETSTNSVVDTIPVGVRPVGVGVDPTGAAVYVANEIDDTVSVIDTETNMVVETIPVGDGPDSQYGLFIGPLVVTDVSIDIKPGNKHNVINPRSKGGIWVAILSDTGHESPFDPSSEVDIPTVEFGPDGAKAQRYKVKDINKDGLGDLLLRFKIRETGIACGDTEATLTGETFDGQSFTGTDAIKTVGCEADKLTYTYRGNSFEEVDGLIFTTNDRVTAQFTIDCAAAHSAGNCANLPYDNYLQLGAVELEPLSFSAGPAGLPTSDGEVEIAQFSFSTDSRERIVDWDMDLFLFDPSGVINVDTDNIIGGPIDSAAALGGSAVVRDNPGEWRVEKAIRHKVKDKNKDKQKKDKKHHMKHHHEHHDKKYHKMHDIKDDDDDREYGEKHRGEKKHHKYHDDDHKKR